MLLLDVRTVVLMLALSDLLMAGGLISIRRPGAHTSGMGLWTIAVVVQAAGWLALGLRDHIPDALSIVLANTLIAASFVLEYAAIKAFRQHPYRKPLLGAVLAAYFAGFFYFYLSGAEPRTRILLAAGVLACLMAMNAHALFIRTSPEERRSHWMTGATFALCAAVLIVRLFQVLMKPAYPVNLFNQNAMQTATFVFLYAAVVGVSFGFILMTKERSDRDVGRLATLDSLTEIYNRRSFLELARKEFARCQRKGQPLSLLMLDLDYFKAINDTYGHAAGDRALKVFTRLVATKLREEDIFGRYGGEEFSLLLPETDEAGARVLAQRLREATGQCRVIHNGHQLSLTVSIGIAALSGPDEIVLDDLFSDADAALYEAKRRGRDRVLSVTELAGAARPAAAS